MTNRLAAEASPYLRQHAHNPVDWYAWGDEAFARARREDKPVLLSVGYSACHWCHVMERESFEDPAIAALMNAHFVSVKVDREERPDIDQIYMDAVQAMTGRGGWPMTVFLTPEGRPFYGGTYFPPVDRHGVPAFPRLLSALADAWARRRGEVLGSAEKLTQELNRTERLGASTTLLTESLLFEAFQHLSAAYDERAGGLGGAPKFPQPSIWDFVLRFWRRTGHPRAQLMVDTTLTRMARGGVYDHLGGGFHRYAVDAEWAVPHFEKMLYDNAQLASLYVSASLAFGRAEYRRVAEETLDYVLREMTDPLGGFYSAQDADSEGEEGRFFAWTRGEIEDALGAAGAPRALAYWGLDAGPNFEGRNVLCVPGEPDPDAMAAARARLFAVRRARVAPGLDDKVLASWNGLMCRAFADAGGALGRSDYLAAAVRNAEFLLGAMRPDGRLRRAWHGGRARGGAYLEDHAAVALGLLALWEATFEPRWLDEAGRLVDQLLDLFWDDARAGFYDTARDHERLIVRPRNLLDNAVPCGSSLAVEALLRLGALTGRAELGARALAALRPMADLMARHPAGVARFLGALDFHLGPALEVALVAERAGSDLDALAAEVFSRYVPNRVLAGAVGGRAVGSAIARAAALPLLEGREALGGRATAFVCRDRACELPVTDPALLAEQLDAALPGEPRP